MYSFKQYLELSKKMLPSPAESEVSTAIVISIKNEISLSKSSTISNSKKEKFSNEVNHLVNSDEFLDNLSDEIGTPKQSESEDEFVFRAKETMKSLLRKRLSGF